MNQALAPPPDTRRRNADSFALLICGSWPLLAFFQYSNSNLQMHLGWFVRASAFTDGVPNVIPSVNKDAPGEDYPNPFKPVQNPPIPPASGKGKRVLLSERRRSDERMIDPREPLIRVVYDGMVVSHPW